MIRPLSNRVALRVDKPARVTGGGLHIAESIPRAEWSGTVLAVGPGRITDNGDRIPIGVEVGQRVAFAKGLGIKWESPEGEVLILSGDALTGTVEG